MAEGDWVMGNCDMGMVLSVRTVMGFGVGNGLMIDLGKERTAVN